MAEAVQLSPGSGLRKELDRIGAGNVSRCYQCATCTSVCDLSTPVNTFPRRQMILAQWGLADRLAADPAVWICHQCADCTERCPRDVRPGDVLQGLRAAVIRTLAFPGWAGKLVGNSKVWWPVLVLVPWLFWIVLLAATVGILPDGHALADEAYEAVVPHWLIYSVYFPVAGWVTLAAAVSGIRFWKLLGRHGPPRKGSFVSGLTAVLIDVAVHRSFSECEANATRRTGHLLLFWGFAGAAITSGLLIVGIYGHHFGIMEKLDFPISLLHPFKILGNLSAVLLVVGGVMLMMNRYGKERSRVGSTSFDNFFIGVVATVIGTGVLTEVVRVFEMPAAAWALYTFHLGIVLTLFITFPYSKFAHMLYRALALVHKRLTEEESAG